MSIATVTETATRGKVESLSLLHDYVKASLNFAGTDRTQPLFTCVNLAATADRLTLMATDKYTASVFRLAYEGDAITEANILRDHLTGLLAVIKARLGKRADVAATLIVSRLFLQVELFGEVIASVPTYDQGFPKIPAMFSTSEPALPAGEIAFNPALMARFAKVPNRDNLPMRLTFTNPLKPAKVEIGEDFTGLIVPMRLAVI